MPATLDPLAALAGLGFGLSLIVAIGAQNAFVLRQGLLRRHVLAVVAVCALFDALLIGLGVAGVGTLLEQAPVLITVARIAGALFLLGYGLLAARRAFRPGAALEVEAATTSTELASESTESASGAEATPTRTKPYPKPKAPTRVRGTGLAATVLTALALTWLNPHVYLDTVVLLGSVATTHGDSRWLFAAGAAFGSVLWFTALGYGARLLRPVFARPVAWRVLDGAIAMIMLAIAASLLLGL